MAIPFIAPLAGFAKGLVGMKGAAAAGAAAKGAAARAAMGTGAKATSRFAGDALRSYLGGSPTAGRLAQNFALDAAFGVMSGLNAPGDIGDKLIAGTSVGLSGALGGIGLTSGYGKLFNKGRVPQGMTRMATEFGGNLLGDEVGFAASNALRRMKGGGTTPYEKMAMEGEMAQRAEIERDVLNRYGLLPSVPSPYHYGDPFMADNGLGQ